jgi:hypothetical protein
VTPFRSPPPPSAPSAERGVFPSSSSAAFHAAFAGGPDAFGALVSPPPPAASSSARSLQNVAELAWLNEEASAVNGSASAGLARANREQQQQRSRDDVGRLLTDRMDSESEQDINEEDTSDDEPHQMPQLE